MTALNIVLVALGIMASASSCDKKDVYTSDTSVLPAEAAKVVSDDFSHVTVNQVKIDKQSIGGDEYKVTFADGTEVEFDSNGKIEEAKAAKGSSLPESIIPAKVLAYVKANYANQKIVKIDFEKNKTEVELTSGMDLEFNAAGDFVKID